MNIRQVALGIGVVYLLVAILGFIPGIVSAPPAGAPDLAVDANHGYLLGIFPINLLHNIVHALVGVAGIMAYRNGGNAARTFLKGLAIFYGLLAILGIIPVEILNTTFGLIPIHGNDVWLHALTAAVAGYFGWKGHDSDTSPALR